MHHSIDENRIAQLRAELARPGHDPCRVHDDLRRLADNLTAQNRPLPLDLREALADTEAEILEDFHDNLPV